jgi:hypothetical protein
MGGRGMGAGAAYGGPSISSYSLHGRGYTRLCTAPCSVTLPSGSYAFAVAKGTGAPIEDEDLVSVPGASTVEGRFHSYRGMRIAGVVITVGSVIGGAYLMYRGVADGPETCDGAGFCQREFDGGKFWPGLGLLVGGTIIGGVLSSKSDEASVRVVPAAAGALPALRLIGSRETERPWSTAAPVPGLTVSARF